jgi:raffinose/stachyose/melibiose transport system substrate-binding protein
MRKNQILKLTLFSLVLAAVVFSFSFYGCTKAAAVETTAGAVETTAAAETTTAETKSSEPVTISLFTQAPGAYPQIFPEIIKNYEAKHPGVTVDMRVVGYGEYMASLATMIAAGEAPDVFLENQGGDLWGVAQSGAAMDLTSYLDANGSEWRKQMYDYIPNLLSWDGKVFGIAASLNNLQLIVNKGLLEEQNLTSPETTDDLIKMAKDLKKSGISPIAFGTADLWTQIDLFTVFVHQQGGGADLRKADMGEIKWSGNPIFIKAMDTIKQLNDAGVFMSGASAMNYHEDAFPVWMQGKTAMLWPGGNFMIQDITPDIKADAIWFPAMPGGKKILTGGTALVWCASSKTKYPDLAVDLLKELTTQETYGLMFENGVAPAGPMEKEVSSKYPLADKVNKDQGESLDRFIYTPEINKEVAIAVQALMAGDVDASGAIDMIQKAADTVYKK